MIAGSLQLVGYGPCYPERYEFAVVVDGVHVDLVDVPSGSFEDAWALAYLYSLPRVRGDR